ncbi:hypothetical protein [Streptomyces sp. NPDC096132]|uniref:hypothetical protein n=1 Tax=Streptomyces sp. NPDC096132 TaxID=3366075 RepID=UPI00381CF313
MTEARTNAVPRPRTPTTGATTPENVRRSPRPRKNTMTASAVNAWTRTIDSVPMPTTAAAMVS